MFSFGCTEIAIVAVYHDPLTPGYAGLIRIVSRSYQYRNSRRKNDLVLFRETAAWQKWSLIWDTKMIQIKNMVW